MGVNGIYGLSGSGLDVESLVKVGMMSKQSEYDNYIKKTIKRNPDAVNWPYAKHYIGMCGNDLCCSSYENATDYYDDMSRSWDGHDYDNDENNITTNDMLTRQISLSFYHT